QRVPVDLRTDEGGGPLIPRGWLLAVTAAAALLTAACEGGNIDAGRDAPPLGILPVDQRNPLIVANDGATDNWSGEYAMLMANSGGPRLVGIIVNPSAYHTD